MSKPFKGVGYVTDTNKRKWLRIDTKNTRFSQQGKIIKQSYLLNSKGKLVNWTEPLRVPEYALNIDTQEMEVL